MTPTDSINAFYDHIRDRDAAAIATAYYPDEQLYVILEGPRLSNRGFDNISRGWIDFCDSALRLAGIDWTEGPYERRGTDLAWVAGVIRMRVTLRERTFERIFRASFVLARGVGADAGRWLIQHEHVSAALDDPYGIGDWLKNPENDPA